MGRNKRFLATLIFTIAIVITTVVMYTPQKAKADTVSFTAEIGSDFSDASFTFSFKDEDKNKEFTVVVYDPDGEEIKTLTLDKDNPKFLLGQSVTAGSYRIELTGESTVYAKSMSYKGTTPSSIVGDTDITITSNITGLKAYFVDGNLVVEWDATIIPNINVKVTNPANMQVLGNDKATGEQASGGEYRLDIPDTVNEVEIYCVATNESRIEGAGQTFVRTVVKNIPGDIEFPDISVTNEGLYDIVANTYDNLGIIVEVNGERVIPDPNDDTERTTIRNLDLGRNEIAVPIQDTMNNVVVYLVDEKGNRSSYKSSISRDTVAPTLTLSENYDGATVEAEAVAIRGYATNGAVSLVINNEPFPLGENGLFSGVVPLSYGDNTIIVAAEDEAGNKSVVSCTITRVEKSFKIESWMIYSVLGVIAVIVALIFKKKKGGFGNPPKDGDKKKLSNKKTEDKKKPEKAPKEIPDRKQKEKKEPKRKPDKAKVKYEKKAPSPHTEKKSSGFGFRVGSLVTPSFIFLFDIICVCLVVIALRLTAIIPVTPVSGSMHPLMVEGDRYYFNRLAYTFTEPARGDIVAFKDSSDTIMTVKRVIGIAGDEISFADGYVFINGKRLDESDYLADTVETNCADKTFTVPEGTVFLMGDNREDSRDSRYWENPYEPVENIIGKYIGDSFVNHLSELM